MKNISIALVLSLLATLSTIARAGDGIMVATGLMTLSNSTKQGGQGSSGSTVLSETEVTYDASWWGLGTYMQYDLQGKNQTDVAMGIKTELHSDMFYFELGYAFLMQRAFNDRSIAKQSGSGYQLGLGTRFPFGAGSAYGKGRYLQFSYKYRTQIIKKQDDSKLDEPIVQTDGYPLFGIGYDF